MSIDRLRGELVDGWLAEHEAEFGAFDEAELEETAAEAGVPYVPRGNAGTVR